MGQGLEAKYINPFLQSAVSVFETMTQVKLNVGKPELAKLEFKTMTFSVQVGVTGEMKGQVLLVMSEENAKNIASMMMFGMPVEILDEMAKSALSELGNMIMGNTATVFSNIGVLIDITPPVIMLGENLKFHAGVQTLKIPLTYNDTEYLSIYICIIKE